ncbi:MDIS1-interacting receptor like kinase [Vigna angularis]|uniref:MDIS1-interacting receptor like kinase n=1 Tax=Phaseolus angularis TaxID=3914 RepID=A0A8T0L303_PHAAN|nr:MDIS1-interacting receptor like kinase [Vigna angularis]
MKKIKNQMKIQLFIFFCYIGCSSYGFSAAVNDEVSTLLSMKAGLIDPLNTLRDWKLRDKAPLKDAFHCSWTGIKCNSAGAVEELDLSHKNLSGTVSYVIQRLKSLTSLNLCCNAFSSPLPKSLANLTTLNKLDVSQNSFNGDFPLGLGRAWRLMTLNASSNEFSGSLPEDLGNASSLEMLDLRGSFFEGSVPKSFSNLHKLKFLGLSGNNLTGKIPGELGQLSSLEYMILGYNEFEGVIPEEFGNLTNLKYLDLAVANLGGEIPSVLGKLKLLNTVFFYNNNFDDRIPAAIGNMTSLQLLDLSDNMLSGKIPAEISQLKNLKLLNLMGNQLSGPVPSGFGDLPQLEVLELWNNSLSGPLPSNLGKNSPLQWLDVSSNSFSGEIPETLCSQGNLTKLILFNNAFSGPIPSSLSTCFSLVRVRIHNNFLSGTIPVGLGKLGKLQRKRSLRTKHMITAWITGISSILVIGIAIVVARSLYIRWYTDGFCFRERFYKGSKGWPWRLMAFQRLGFTSTEILACIKETNVIGMGATGIVYKAEVPQSNTVVAVKKLWRTGTDIEVGSSDDLVGEKNETVSMVAGSYGYIAPDSDFGESTDIVEWIRMKIRDNKSLEEALDPSVGNSRHVVEEMLLVLRIAILCTAKLPKDRPTMRDVIMMLGEAKPRRKSGGNDAANNKESPVFSTSPVNGLM